MLGANLVRRAIEFFKAEGALAMFLSQGEKWVARRHGGGGKGAVRTNVLLRVFACAFTCAFACLLVHRQAHTWMREIALSSVVQRVSKLPLGVCHEGEPCVSHATAHPSQEITHAHTHTTRTFRLYVLIGPMRCMVSFHHTTHIHKPQEETRKQQTKASRRRRKCLAEREHG